MRKQIIKLFKYHRYAFYWYRQEIFQNSTFFYSACNMLSLFCSHCMPSSSMGLFLTWLNFFPFIASLSTHQSLCKPTVPAAANSPSLNLAPHHPLASSTLAIQHFLALQKKFPPGLSVHTKSCADVKSLFFLSSPSYQANKFTGL